MSKVQILRHFVNERLTAAAEEIFALFERTIAEYEEELCRSKEENKRKQQLLDSVVSPQVLLHRADVQIHLMSAGPSLNQEITETPQIKEELQEQSIKQEEDQLQEFAAVSVKGEKQPSVLQQRQNHREEMQSKDCERDISDHEEHTDNDDNWKPPVRSSTQHKISRSDVRVKTEKHKCSFCKKIFSNKHVLQRHRMVHTGEKPYSCSICQKTFAQKINFKTHMRTHTGERPYSCSICQKSFAQKIQAKSHMRTHTGERPYSCSICQKSFAQKIQVKSHMKIHTGEKPYMCSMCDKTFTQQIHRKRHENTHRRKNV